VKEGCNEHPRERSGWTAASGGRKRPLTAAAGGGAVFRGGVHFPDWLDLPVALKAEWKDDQAARWGWLSCCCLTRQSADADQQWSGGLQDYDPGDGSVETGLGVG
jgi:hypothetical protein